MIMKLLKSIVARFLAFWALFMFAASMFVYMWFYLYCLILREPKKQNGIARFPNYGWVHSCYFQGFVFRLEVNIILTD